MIVISSNVYVYIQNQCNASIYILAVRKCAIWYALIKLISDENFVWWVLIEKLRWLVIRQGNNGNSTKRPSKMNILQNIWQAWINVVFHFSLGWVLFLFKLWHASNLQILNSQLLFHSERYRLNTSKYMHDCILKRIAQRTYRLSGLFTQLSLT